jgi:site-specific DNA recombinase
VAMKRLDDVWDQLFPAEQMRIVRLLVRQVTVSPNNMSMDLHPTGIQRLVLELHHKKLQSEPATEMEAEAMA